jgi:hypothetical protein
MVMLGFIPPLPATRQIKAERAQQSLPFRIPRASRFVLQKNEAANRGGLRIR